MSASRRTISLLICLLLIGGTALAYSGLINHELVSVDDETYLTNNPPVRAGLTWAGVKWAFTTFHASNWHPLTWISLMASCNLFGVWPPGHHFVNELLHIANVVLLFLLLVRLTDRIGPSAFVAGVFALHPVHVESVAWLAERKDVLSGLFFFLTLHAYVSYARKPTLARMSLVTGLYVLGLLSKPMLVTLPFVMLLLDWWPLQRFNRVPSPESGRGGSRSLGVIVEKMPLFVLAIAMCIVTLFAQRSAMVNVQALPIGLRLENAIVSIVRYLGHAFWPVNLYLGYPLVEQIPLIEVVGAGALIVLITIVAFRYRSRHPYLLVGWCWFLGMLVPVLGIVQVGGQAMADRYMYLPMIGLTTAVAFFVEHLVTGGRGSDSKPRAAVLDLASMSASIAGVGVLIALGIATSIQLRYWTNSVALFERSISLNRDNLFAEQNYARALLLAGRGDEAIGRYRALVDKYPFYSDGRKSLALSLVAKGDLNEAASVLEPALSIGTNDPEIPYLAGFIAAKQHRDDDAIKLYRQSVAINDDNVVAHYELCRLLKSRDPSAATIEAQKVIAMRGATSDPHLQMAQRLLAINNLDDAERAIWLSLALDGTLGPEEQSSATTKQSEIEARCAERLNR